MSIFRNHFHTLLLWLFVFAWLLPESVQASVSSNPRIPANHPDTQAIPTHPEAAVLHQAGLHREAVELCASVLVPTDPPPGKAHGCRLLSASSLLELQRWDEAVEILEPARGSLGPLEPWAALLLGQAHAAAGRDDKAIPLLKEAAAADPTGPLGRRAEVPMALALAHAGKIGEATQTIEALLKGRRGPAPTLRLALAEATEAAGDGRKAAALYKEVWRLHPETTQAPRAWERLQALIADGVPSSPPSDDDRLARAERLVAVGHATEALAELAHLKAPSSTPAIALLRARALSSAERKAEAEEVLAPALAPGVPPAVRSKALELAGRLAMRRGAVDEALAHLRNISGGAQGREAEFLAAFFLYDAGRFEEAEKAFRTFAGRHRDSGRAEEALWYVAWTLYKQGDFPAASRALEELLHKHPRSPLAPQARYWRARSLEKAGKDAGALYAELTERDPTEFYAILARYRLSGGEPAAADARGPAKGPADVDEATGAESEPPAARAAPDTSIPAGATAGSGPEHSPARPEPSHAFRPFTPPSSPPPFTGLSRARMDRAIALYGIGLRTEGGLELDGALEGQKGAAPFAAAAHLALSSGDYHRAWQWGLFRLGGIQNAADLAYPRAWGLEVESAARRFGIDPHFVWSIMRQESGFRPGVRSPAAAVGLMQILPTTAAQIAARLGLPRERADQLEDPRVNVTLGTWYLAALLERFEGNHALAAASYNAGPGAVVRWLSEPARKDLPLDEFVESIPYRETRHYVKKVLSNHEAYRLIHGGEPLPWGEALPRALPGVEF